MAGRSNSPFDGTLEFSQKKMKVLRLERALHHRFDYDEISFIRLITW